MNKFLAVAAIMAATTSSSVSPAFSYPPAKTIPVKTIPPKPKPNTLLRILGLTNQERMKMNLATLRPSNSLNLAAQRHAEDMLRNNIFSHVGSKGSTLTHRIDAANYYYEYIGENIFMQTPQNQPDQAVIRWMNSPGHRRNILNHNYTEIGLGYATDGDKHYYVQVFGKPAAQ
jgi:uncharacterized protein YkwD